MNEIPSPLWTENQRLRAVISELRAALAAANARAEAAEQDASDVRRWADAVPVDEISTAFRAATEVYGLAHDRSDVRLIRSWLAQQSEVQP